MSTLTITQVGAQPFIDPSGARFVSFGIYLPGITPADGYDAIVRIIHSDDQLTPGIPPVDFHLTWSKPDAYDFWSISNISLTAAFGKQGRFLYRYQLKKNGTVVVDWFTDPFARAAGTGELAAFDTEELAFQWSDYNYTTPLLDDLIVYELQVEQFNDSFQGVIDRLPYLQGLGVNCLELMPVTSLKQDFDWGYGPLHFFAPNQALGGAFGLKSLVDAAHARGMAIILDSVYQHVDPAFAYFKVYQYAGLPSPMIWPVDPVKPPPYGPETMFGTPFTQDYFLEVNKYWLNDFHVDGFRYDYVPGYYDGDPTNKYGQLVYQTHKAAFTYPRFGNNANGGSGIIQVAEDLDDPEGILRQTYTNATWQDGLLHKAEDYARLGRVDDAFALLLNPTFEGYPATQSMNGVDLPVAPFQYIESHDHSSLAWFTQHAPSDDTTGVVYADRSRWYKLQPFAIALYTCQGVPMLWEGQEFADNYVLPPGGDLRIHFRRTVNWQYFYDNAGQTLVTLYRKLAALRRGHRALRSRKTFYYNQQSNPGQGVIAYHRIASNPDEVAVVFLNFSDSAQTISIPFPRAGTYVESLIGDPNGLSPLQITIPADGDFATVTVPSNYGYIYLM